MDGHFGASDPGEQRVPVAEVLSGLEVQALERGATAIEALPTCVRSSICSERNVWVLVKGQG